MKKAKFIKTKKSIDANVFKLQLDEVVWVNGRRAIRDVIRHNGITAIVPIIEKKYIILIKQYRYGADRIMLEVPAGTIDPGEKPLQCAKRELIEETGYHGKQWKLIGKYFPTPAYNTCIIHSYLTHCYKQTETNYDEDEVLHARSVDIDLKPTGRQIDYQLEYVFQPKPSGSTLGLFAYYADDYLHQASFVDYGFGLRVHKSF